ncbi:MAG: cellulase [Planctomycetes bacterium]|nr:cellulase [Planctomycetota bacterium]
MPVRRSLLHARLSTSASLLLAAAAWCGAETITIDAGGTRRPIDPLVYGTNFATAAQLADLNCLVNRHGGNTTTRYNWQANASNHAQDWYFESIPDGPATPAAAIDGFIADARAGGAQPMITVPMLGWVAKVGAGRQNLCSFSQAKYGQQTGNDWQWFPDAGNGVRVGGSLITTNDPTDANVPADVAFQQGLVQHLVSRWGTSAQGGVRYYLLDNEHGLWQSTHRDVKPVGPTMDEIAQKMVAYARMIKAADPAALVVGPEEWGWSGYLYSGYDQQWGSSHGWGNLPDRAQHGGMDYLPWLLGQIRQASVSAGIRLLDVFTVHYYPQGGEYGDDVSTAMQERRNRSTRSLWDPTYVDESWIGTQVRLMPRLHDWVTQRYPGTRIGLTEYSWGADAHINGATAQADVLGILGREGCDIATRWTTPATNTPTYLAMKLYRNYDGAKSTFGDQSLSIAVVNPDRLSAFASVRSSDGALTVMLVQKQLSGAIPVTLALDRFTAGTAATVWQVTATNRIDRRADAAVSASTVTVTLPPQSVTLVVIPAAAGGTTGSTTTTGGTTAGTTTSGSTSGATGSTAGTSTGTSTTGGNTGSGSTTGTVVPSTDHGGGGKRSCGMGAWLAVLCVVALGGAHRRRSRTDGCAPHQNQ